MYSEIASNKRKTWIIMFFFMLLVSGLGYVFSAFFLGEPSITVIVVVIALAYALISYYSGSKMALVINGAREITREENPRLYNIVENLTITEGMPMPKVYVIDDPGLNAFATGRDPQHASVAATSGILHALNDTELEGVMAHELGHVKNYDIRVSMIAFALVAVIALISDIMLRSMFWGGGNRREGGGNLGLILVLVAAILAPLAATLLKMAISRKREYLADATGALTTRYPEGLASALEKLQGGASRLQRDNTSTAHLFIANPLSGKSVTALFSTHPPIEERIARLRGMEGKL